jgi:hypothetical protein
MGWLVAGFVGLLLIPAAWAQSPQAPVTREVSGEVLQVDGFNLVVKMIPSGEVRTFTAQQGRTATIDGKTVTLDKVSPGTVLTAKVTWVPAPENVTTVNGEVLFTSFPYVSVKLADGTIKQFTVPEDFEFDYNGRKGKRTDLRPGIKLSAVRLNEDPATKITPESPITGKAKK